MPLLADSEVLTDDREDCERRVNGGDCQFAPTHGEIQCLSLRLSTEGWFALRLAQDNGLEAVRGVRSVAAATHKLSGRLPPPLSAEGWVAFGAAGLFVAGQVAYLG